MRSAGHAPGLGPGLALVAALAACSDSPEGPSAPVRPDAPARRAVEPGETGTVRVLVRVSGEPPPPRALDVRGDSGCEHDGPLLAESLVVAPDGGLANALVLLPDAHERWVPPPPPAEAARLDQRGCVFRPHVVALRAGGTLVVHNLDAVTHNVHLRARRNTGWNRTQAAGADALRFAPDRAELSIPVQCDIHPWMGAWVHVLDHPWFGVTGADGRASIAAVPAGVHTLEVRHETLGRRRAEVTVEPGAEAAVVVTFEAADGGAAR